MSVVAYGNFKGQLVWKTFSNVFLPILFNPIVFLFSFLTICLA
jgi:hypothetical protein